MSHRNGVLKSSRAVAAKPVESEPPREQETTALDIATPEAFAIVDAKSANWVIRRIREAREYAQAVEEWAEGEKSRAAHAEAFFLERFGAQLEAFAREAIAEQNVRFKHDARKSLKLPAGTIGFRAQPVRVRVVDEDTVLNWCRAHLPAAIRVSERVSKTAINEHFEATNELPDGAAIDAEAERFYVK